MKPMQFQANLTGMQQALSYIEKTIQLYSFPLRKDKQIAIIADELVSNIIRYAYPMNQGYFLVKIKIKKNKIKLQFCDYGIPFNPLLKEVSHVQESYQTRPIGGLGIHIVKQLASRIKYKRKKGKNIVTVIVSCL